MPSETKKMNALLVGIDKYDPKSHRHGVKDLKGCKNDIAAMSKLLKNDFAHLNPNIATLTDKQATRAGVIAAFRQHLHKNADEHTSALFYFSGHGSRQGTPKEFQKYLADKTCDREETLICYDSRADKNKELDLADKELAILIEELAQKGVHVVIILDCCHSGSATRNTDEDLPELVREVEERTLTHPSNRVYLDRYYEKMLEAGKEVVVPRSKHVLLAGCQQDQYSREIKANGIYRGAFSYHLEQTIKTHGTQLTYANLFSAANAEIRMAEFQNKQKPQHPHFESFDGFDSHSLIFEGTNASNESPRHEVHCKKGNWMVDFGMIAGMAAGFGMKATFDIYDHQKEGKACTSAQTTLRNLNDSVLKVKAPKKLDTNKRYWAKLTNLPFAKTPVHVEGKPKVVAYFRQRLADAGSVYIQYNASPKAPIKLMIEEDAYHIYHNGEQKYTCWLDEPMDMRQAISKMEQIARWETLLHATNKATKIKENEVRFHFQEGHNLHRKAGLSQRGYQQYAVKCEFGKYYQVEDDTVNEWSVPYAVMAQNKSKQKLYFTLLNFSSDYGIHLLETTAAQGRGESDEVVLTDSLSPLDNKEEVTYLKLLASTKQLKPYVLTQPDLNDENPRPIHGKPEAHTPDDWTSKTIALKIGKA